MLERFISRLGERKSYRLKRKTAGSHRHFVLKLLISISDINMPKPKSSKQSKLPKSRMIRVPTPLIEAFQKLSWLHREGHTTLILEKLQELISSIDSSSKIEFEADSSSKIKQLEEKIIRLETQVADMKERMGQFEIALMSRGSGGSKRSSGYQVGSPPQLDKMEEANLARRLGIDVKTLINMRETNSPDDLRRYCSGRDPMQLGWKYNSEDGLYYPVRQ